MPTNKLNDLSMQIATLSLGITPFSFKNAATSFDFLSSSKYDIFLSSKINAVSLGCFATTSSKISTTDLSES